MSIDSAVPATRRHLNARQAETVQRIVEAGRAALVEEGFDAFTVRAAASRAAVAPATAYTYFSSRNHLVVEIFWRRMNERGRVETRARTPLARVTAIFDDLAEFLETEPELALATTTAMLAPEPDVRQLRFLIGTEMNERIADAVGDVTPAKLDALALIWSGAMLQAGMGHSDYSQMSARLASAAKQILGR